MAEIVLAPVITIPGIIERVLLHEVPTPNFPVYNAEQSLMAMRLIRRVLKNRLKHPGVFGVPGAKTEMEILHTKVGFGGFSTAPKLAPAFMFNVANCLEVANNPKHPRCPVFRKHVEQSIIAATETNSPPEFILPDLYYWRTGGSKSPGRFATLYRKLQGLDFYTQDNLD